jgi:hypothetical protein
MADGRLKVNGLDGRSAPPFRRPIGHRTGKAARASDSESIVHSPPTGDIEMLPFIVLALLAALVKSPVAIAGLLSYIGVFGYISWQQRMSGQSLDRSRRGASVAGGHFETTDHLQQDIAVRPAGRAIAGSGLVRRLVRAKDDPAKQCIRPQLSEIDDERLVALGLASEDIAALRGTASAQVEADETENWGKVIRAANIKPE